jgi:hypothetical protein
MNKNVSMSLFLQAATRNAVFISGHISDDHRTIVLNLLDRIANTPHYLLTFELPVIDVVITFVWRLLLLNGEKDVANWIVSYICRISTMFGFITNDIPPPFLIPSSFISPNYKELIDRVATLLSVKANVNACKSYATVSIISGVPSDCLVFKHILSVLDLSHYVVVGGHPQRDQTVEFMQTFIW